VLQRRSSDEFSAPAYTDRDRRMLARVQTEGPELAGRLHVRLSDFWSGRLGTAAALRAVDEAWGGGFYRVPPEAALDRAAADEALGGDQVVIDVQTHCIAPDREAMPAAAGVLGFLQGAAPDRWRGLKGMAGFGLAEYLRYVFLESETAVAILTSGGDGDTGF